MQAFASLSYNSMDDIRQYSRFITASVVLHLICFLILVLAPYIKSRNHFSPAVINVDLVSLPSGNSLPRTKKVAASTIRKPSSAAKATVITKKKKKQIAIKKSGPTGIRIKKSLKKKTFKPSEVINEAIKNVKNSVDTSQQDALKNAMKKIARQVKSEDATRANQKGFGTGYSGYRRVGADFLSVYKAEIFSRIQKNWSFSEHLAGNRTDLAVKLAIKIMPDGEIRDIWFDERSGNSYLDESAKKAVLKSNPLPPLPKGFNKPFLNQGLRFTPSGIR